MPLLKQYKFLIGYGSLHLAILYIFGEQLKMKHCFEVHSMF